MSYPQSSPQAQDILDAFTVVKGTNDLQDEDCLTLKIWTKFSPVSHGKDKPVVIFIYGGRKFVDTQKEKTSFNDTYSRICAWNIE